MPRKTTSSMARIFFAALVLGFALCNSASAQSGWVPASRLKECADSARDSAKRVHNVDLDFSPESLAYVDGIASDFHTRKFPYSKIQNHLLVFSCYAGEVFIRNLDGKWIHPNTEDVEKLGAGPFVELPRGLVVNPIMKVHKIYENGLEDSVVKLFKVTKAAIQQGQ